MRESFSDLEKDILNRVNNTMGPILLGNLVDDYLPDVLLKFQLNCSNRLVTFCYDENTSSKQLQVIIDKYTNFFIEVIGILELFEREGYIYVYNNSTPQLQFPMGRLPANIPHIEYYNLDLSFQKEIVHFAVSEIYRTPALKEFIENRFKKSDVIRFEKSLKYAICGIIVAITIGLLSFFTDISGVKLFSNIILFPKNSNTNVTIMKKSRSNSLNTQSKVPKIAIRKNK